VRIQTETSREPNPVNSKVLVFALPPKAFQAGRCLAAVGVVRAPLTAAMERAGRAPFDVGTLKAYLQTAAARVQCGEHGLVVAHV
jgi:hypothetical protein